MREKCRNMEFFLVRIFPHSDKKKLRISTLFTQRIDSHSFSMAILVHDETNRKLEWKERFFFPSYVIHFSPIFHLYTLLIRQRSKDFLTFSGSIEMEHWVKMG